MGLPRERLHEIMLYRKVVNSIIAESNWSGPKPFPAQSKSHSRHTIYVTRQWTLTRADNAGLAPVIRHMISFLIPPVPTWRPLVSSPRPGPRTLAIPDLNANSAKRKRIHWTEEASEER